MNRIFLIITICLFEAYISLAGEVRVLQTEAVDITFDWNSNLYVQMNVKLQVANTSSEECAVIMVMDNLRWPETITINQLVDLIDTRCYEEAFVPIVNGRGQRTVEIVIPLEQKKLSGKGATLYAKAYVFNLKTEKIVSQGTMIEFTPNYEAIREEMMNAALGVAGSLLEGLFGGGGGSKKDLPKNAETCYRCDGTGECQACNGTGGNYDATCSACHGSGRCSKCDGTGYTYSLMPIR